MVNYEQIRESLNLVELSEEEKKSRGILARLYGPCASIVDATRNGRLYSDELWEKVFNENEIVKEMFENGGCAMELDHPVDREETDSTRIAAMLPEPPKRDKDGHLVCYVDIIDTPCGQVAYQLAKYGFKLGISSRGSGDILPDDSVDPSTYDFTTFDLVLLPAVKDARLSMCESFDVNNLKLKQALIESYDSQDDRGKNVMKQTLENLGLNIIEDISKDTNTKSEDADNNNYTVGDLEKDLEEYDKDTTIEFKPIVINNIEYPIEMLEFEELKDNKLIVSVGYTQETGDNIQDETENTDIDDDSIKQENAAEEVIDDESDAVIESLKDAIRQKDSLAIENKALKDEKAVRDAEVKTLSEELTKYKLAFNRTSGIAANAKRSEKEILDLKEQLSQKNVTIQQNLVELNNAKKRNASVLNESMSDANNKIKTLNEHLKESKLELDKRDEKIKEQSKKLIECSNIAKKYKAQTKTILNEYVNFRASLLGIKPSEITNRLDENYSMSDINNVCDSILELGSNDVSFNISRSSRIKINESKAYKNSDDDLSDLYELAGLK